MPLPLILFVLVGVAFAVVGFVDKAKYKKKIAEQAAQQNKQSN